MVSFFVAPAGAERQGFRPCRRCKPTEADPWIDRIQRACAYLAQVEGQPSLTALAKRFGGSPYHFHRKFTRLVGVTPRKYAEAVRLGKVKQRLQEGNPVTDAILDAGYGSSSRFYEHAVPKLGMSPSTYRRGGAGMSIRYTVVESPLGRLLVGATARGVCAIAMGSSDKELENALAKEYPAAKIAADEGSLAAWTQKILAHLDGKQPRLDLPLDIQATAFQSQVWEALRSIPYGSTKTYGEIAASIGKPRAVRAVARACATNPVAIAIPCHRVVAADGSEGGYRWGVERKEALLRREHGR